MVGGTYRVKYLGANGKERQFLGQFNGLEVDPVVAPDGKDHIAFKFTMTTPTVEELDTGQTFTIDAPDPSVPLRFHLWQEDLIDAVALTHGQEPTG